MGIKVKKDKIQENMVNIVKFCRFIAIKEIRVRKWEILEKKSKIWQNQKIYFNYNKNWQKLEIFGKYGKIQQNIALMVLWFLWFAYMKHHTLFILKMLSKVKHKN